MLKKMVILILCAFVAALVAACALPLQTLLPAAGATPSPARPRPTETSTLLPTATARPATPQPSATRPPLPSATATSTQSRRLPSFGHIFIIVMENKEAVSIVDNKSAPFISGLAKQYAYAANYYAVSHPSLPNYLALSGGSTFGIVSDCTDCFVSGQSIVDQVENAGRTWKSYIESMPQPCYLGADTSLYARRHNPFLYYDSVRNDAARCKNIVPLTELETDLHTGALPDFVWITPNLCHDMHNCPVSSGDDWLRTWLPKIQASSAWKDSVLFLTFDEGTSNSGCCQYAAGGKVSTLVISRLVKPGFVSQIAYDHYSIVRTIEEAWGILPLLGHAGCDCTTPMTDFFAPP